MPIQTPQDYLKAEDLSNYQYQKGDILKLSGFCAKCKEKVVEPRGSVNKFGACLEFDYAGICYECKTITPFRMRFYPEDKRIVQAIDGKWYQSNLVRRTWWRELKQWFGKLINKKI